MNGNGADRNKIPTFLTASLILETFAPQMTVRGRELALLVTGVLWTASLTFCFNLEPETGQVYSYPYGRTQGRESYFGFSVALQHNDATNTNW